jgi:galactokinase
VARGADGALFFQWRASRAGAEKFHSGMVPHAGTDTRIWREVVGLGHDLRRMSQVTGTSTAPAPVAIVFDWPSWWAAGLDSHPSADVDPLRTARRWHDLCWRTNVGVDIIGPDADLARYRVVVVPVQYLMSAGTAERLGAYVDAVGTLVATYFSGIVDEHDRIHLGGYPGALRTLLGITVEEFYPLAARQSVDLSRYGPGTVWSEAGTATTAEVRASFVDGPTAGSPVVTRNAHGAGYAWYVATELSQTGLAELGQELFAAAGARPTVEGLPAGVEAVRRIAPDGDPAIGYLFVINHTGQPVDLDIAGTDLLTGIASDRARVGPGDVAVIRESPADEAGVEDCAALERPAVAWRGSREECVMAGHSSWRAPGRVNLIGEHTDYNGGLALPFAIDRVCRATVAADEGGVLRMRSTHDPDPYEVVTSGLEPGGVEGWPAYVAGVWWAIGELGAQLPAVTVDIDSSVPVGAGLSSSAALTCSVAAALDEIGELGFSRRELVDITMRAENEFAGAPTGGLDQIAALQSIEGHALLCDFREIFEHGGVPVPVPLDLDRTGHCVLVVDTRAEHRNADSEYAVRRDSCERAAAMLGVASLRDVVDLDDALQRLTDDDLRRCTRHVVTENERVLQTVGILRDGSPVDIGPLLTASHRSLRDDYRVSCPELDLAVDALLEAGALGARMTGGGFGGSAIGLIARARVAAATESVGGAFAAADFRPPAAFEVRASDGARRMG